MINHLLESIFNTIFEANKELSAREIYQKFNRIIPLRTIQRYLSNMVQKGIIETVGKGRQTKYKTRAKRGKSVGMLVKSAIIPLSKKAQKIQSQITASIQTRKHVNYNPNFLKSYIPNNTFYLTCNERQALISMGQASNGDNPAGTYAKKIFHKLLIDLSWNSSRLEGNTYSLLETERLIEFNEPSDEKDATETQMILNHKAAIEYLINTAEQIQINSFSICNLHALLANNLLRDPRACGQLRSIPVGIEQTVYIPTAIPQLIEEYFRLILNTASKIIDPFEQSFFLMVHLPYLQPFEDVNKRVSRLACNIPLIKKNLAPLSFVDVPKETYISGLIGVYELNQIALLKEIYIWAYERSCSLYAATRKALGQPDPFRLKYHKQINNLVRNVILLKMNMKNAHHYIEREKVFIPEVYQNRFVQVVEEEILGLHEGNILRYQINLDEYNIWKAAWK